MLTLMNKVYKSDANTPVYNWFTHLGRGLNYVLLKTYMSQLKDYIHRETGHMNQEYMQWFGIIITVI